MQDIPTLLSSWTEGYIIQILASLLVIFVYFFLVRITDPKILESIQTGNFKAPALLKANRSVRIIFLSLGLSIMLMIWGVEFKNLILLSTSIFAITGVALFANWSVLSNISSFFLLLFHKLFKHGDFVRVIDGDNYIEGHVTEINLFNTVIMTEEQGEVIYPNNLLTSRPLFVNPKSKYKAIGKVADFNVADVSEKDNDSV